MKAGHAFLQLDSPGAKPHLWVIISDPEQDAERVLLVSFTSWEAYKDPACRIHPGEHSFVKHPTCVSYQHARLVSLADLQALQADGFLQPYERVSEDLLRRIRNCAGDSIYTPNECWELLDEQGLIDPVE